MKEDAVKLVVEALKEAGIEVIVCLPESKFKELYRFCIKIRISDTSWLPMKPRESASPLVHGWLEKRQSC